MLHREHNAAGQVAPIGVVPDLIAVAQDVQGALALEHLLDQVGDDMAHRQLDVSALYLDVPESALLPGANAIEGPDDGVGQTVLLVGAAGEVFDRQLLKAVRGEWRGHLLFLALDRWPVVSTLED